MTFQKQEQITKKNSDDLLSELINYNGENLIGEIVRLGIQNLKELERDEHISYTTTFFLKLIIIVFSHLTG